MRETDPLTEPLEDVRADLVKAKRSLRILLELSHDLIVVERGGRIVGINRVAGRALSLSLGEADTLVGTPIEEIFHEGDRAALSARLRAAREASAESAQASPESSELRWLRKGGGYRTTESSIATVEVDGLPATIISARDVTERVEFQQQLLQRDRMAALGTLSAGVAHEINNPLTYMLVNLEHVLRRLRAASASDDPGRQIAGSAEATEGLANLIQSLQQAMEGANRVRHIVRDLLTFAQGNVEHRGLVDLRGIVESAAQMAWHEIRHRARLSRCLAEVPPVEANESPLGQVFLNLLVNAAQALPEGQADRHEVRVATRTDERGNAVVEVSDTGVGIAAEHMPRIFDPFFTTKGESGTGLGLAVSLGTVKSLGGDIQVTSAPGMGTTFRVVLPAAKRWRGALPTSSHEERALRRRVLVIDDEKLVGLAIARSLSEDNDVAVATEAREALARIAGGDEFDVILCDLMMPIMTGMDLYAEIMRSTPQMANRLVFMTGGAFTPRARAFLESVNNPWLEKPLDMGKLRSLVSRAGRQ
ncbi:MAG: ATP-binding protein [Polyangiaceae bacterium]|jgi:PAS domain S-box-containing protein